MKKRDHRRLGPALGLFAFHDVAPGAAFWLPNGTTLYNVLSDAMRRLVSKNGYQEVKTPLLFNKRLWEKSGHWGVYRENMFLVFDKEADPTLPIEERLSSSLKPMNCPSHYLIFGIGQALLPRAAGPLLHGGRAAPQRALRLARRPHPRPPVRAGRRAPLLHRGADRGGGGPAGRADQTVYGAFGLEFIAPFSTRPEAEELGDDELWHKAGGRAPRGARPVGRP